MAPADQGQKMPPFDPDDPGKCRDMSGRLKRERAWLDSRPEIGQGYGMMTMLILG